MVGLLVARKKGRPVQDVILWLIRHGETVWNAEHKISGWHDVELSERGRQMARDLRPRLQGRSFCGVFSSDLRRARDTAELAFGPAEVDVRLRELDFGPLEGLNWNLIPVEHQQAVLEFREDCTRGGEKISHFEERVLDFVDQLPSGQHLLFVHGGLIRIVLRQVEADQFVPPTTVVVVNWTQKRLVEMHLGPQ